MVVQWLKTFFHIDVRPPQVWNTTWSWFLALYMSLYCSNIEKGAWSCLKQCKISGNNCIFSWQRKPPLCHIAWRREEYCFSYLPLWAQGVEQKYEYIKERTSYIVSKHEQLIQIQTSPLHCTAVYFFKFILPTIFSFRNLSTSATEKCLKASAFLPRSYAMYLSKRLVQNLVARAQ